MKLLTQFFLILISFNTFSVEPEHEKLGLHVYSGFGNKHYFITSRPTVEKIRKTLSALDWEEDFHQVVLVISPGESIEVGGSLNPNDGLSSVYRNNNENIYRVTRVPPSTVKEMERILISFVRGDGLWESMYIYE